MGVDKKKTSFCPWVVVSRVVSPQSHFARGGEAACCLTMSVFDGNTERGISVVQVGAKRGVQGYLAQKKQRPSRTLQ